MAGGGGVVTQKAGQRAERGESHSPEPLGRPVQAFRQRTDQLARGGASTPGWTTCLRKRQLDEKTKFGNISEPSNANAANVWGINVESKAAFTSWFQSGAASRGRRASIAMPWSGTKAQQKKDAAHARFLWIFHVMSPPLHHLTA